MPHLWHRPQRSGSADASLGRQDRGVKGWDGHQILSHPVLAKNPTAEGLKATGQGAILPEVIHPIDLPIMVEWSSQWSSTQNAWWDAKKVNWESSY